MKKKTIREILNQLVRGDERNGTYFGYKIDQAEAEIKALVNEKEIERLLNSEDKGYGFVSHHGDCTNEPQTCLRCLSKDVAQALKQWWDSK